MIVRLRSAPIEGTFLLIRKEFGPISAGERWGRRIRRGGSSDFGLVGGGWFRGYVGDWVGARWGTGRGARFRQGCVGTFVTAPALAHAEGAATPAIEFAGGRGGLAKGTEGQVLKLAAASSGPMLEGGFRQEAGFMEAQPGWPRQAAGMLLPNAVLLIAREAGFRWSLVPLGR